MVNASVTMSTGVRVRSFPGLPADTRAASQRLARWLRATQPIPHRVQVHLANAKAIRNDTGIVWACFWRPNTAPKPGMCLDIYVAGLLVEVLQEEHGASRIDGITTLLDTILHEYAHYEEWRQGKRANEVRANRRAAELLRAFVSHPLGDYAAASGTEGAPPNA